MKCPVFTKSLQCLLSVCYSISLVALCVCCSENVAESVQAAPPVVEEKVSYDSTYNSIYDLYVVENDTTPYNLQSYNSPLTQEEKMVNRSLNEYAVKMLSDYSSTNSENTILSPFSASMLYSLMSNFTDETNNAFKESMGIASVYNKIINSLFRKILNQRGMFSNQDGTEERMSLASNLWMNKKSAVYKSFLSTSKYYNYNVKGIDLDKESSIEAINSLVQMKMGSNDAMITKSSIERSKPLVTSSITFNGEWKEKFHLDSAQTNLFTNIDGSKTLCKILRAKRKGRYARFDAFDMMEIPYKNNLYSMYIVLPHEADGLSKSLTELRNYGMARGMALVSDTTRTYHGEYLIPRDTTTSQGSFTVVDTLITDTIFDIRIPKFKLCASTALNPSNLQGNSATKIMYQTNLPKVSPNGYTLSNVFQSCSFEINEQATSASSDDSVSTYTGGTYFSGNPTEHHNYLVNILNEEKKNGT